MKKIMQLAGVEGKQVLFYFPDNHIVDERFLEDVNNVLNAGEVPNLFEADERQKVLDGTAPAVRALGMDERMVAGIGRDGRGVQSPNQEQKYV